MKQGDTILTLNAGSSSLKFGLYRQEDDQPVRVLRGAISGLDGRPRFEVAGLDGPLFSDTPAVADHEQAVVYLFAWLEKDRTRGDIAAVGHRVVHGGARFTQAVRIDAEILAQLHAYVPLAPLHMPHNLAAISALQEQRPRLPQVACFDTAFHRSMPAPEQYYALPREWYARGVRRYGFHGLSYEYIASVLPQHLGEGAEGRVVVAHLGHGASLCALHQRRSVATSMGFTPLDGIPMATRPGSLDPGIITYLMREAGLSVAEVDELLNDQSGLLGLSGISGDMRELLSSGHPHAEEAIAYFVHHSQRAIASLAATLGGLDALVFTAGIGENAPRIRERICQGLDWLGISIDSAANAEDQPRISTAESTVSVWRIPTDEESVIAHHVYKLLAGHEQGALP